MINGADKKEMKETRGKCENIGKVCLERGCLKLKEIGPTEPDSKKRRLDSESTFSNKTQSYVISDDH